MIIFLFVTASTKIAGTFPQLKLEKNSRVKNNAKVKESNMERCCYEKRKVDVGKK